MDYEDKLRGVIERAIEEGWEVPPPASFSDSPTRYYMIRFWEERLHEFELLFDHDFAKAFFGEEEVNANEIEIKASQENDDWEGTIYSGGVEDKAWKLHLQQAVLSKDPLSYYFKQL